MKSHTSVSKTTRNTTGDSSPHSSAGENTVAIAPPAYGIDFVDRVSKADAGPLLQSEFATRETPVQLQSTPGYRNNDTGLPDRLKIGMENLSGYAMDDVRVHYNSSKPAQLNALAYAQGTNIHLGRGQEKHLPHEAWHVVQQKQGRVSSTRRLEVGPTINDDSKLEHEADKMGQLAVSTTAQHAPSVNLKQAPSDTVVQRRVGFEFEVSADDVRTYKWVLGKGHTPLSKRDKMLEGQDFYIEADGLPSGESSMEFVTEAFPEDLAGLNRLIGAMDHIEGILHILNQQTVNDYQWASGLRAHGNHKSWRSYKVTSKPIRIKPQVTAGFSLTAMDRLFHSASAMNGPTNLIRLAQSWAVNAQQDDERPQGAAKVDLANMRTAVGQEIAANIDGPVDPGLRAFVTQLVSYVIAGQNDLGATPKTIGGEFLLRTDFAHTFLTLPEDVREHFEDDDVLLQTLVLNSIQRANLAVPAANARVIAGRLFANAMYANDDRFQMASPYRVTIEQWLRGITGGTDLMTKQNYPKRGLLSGHRKEDKKAAKLLGSMGELGHRLDPGDRPVSELRGIKLIYAGLLRPFALDFFRNIAVLNQDINGEQLQHNAMTQDQILSLLWMGDEETHPRADIVDDLNTQARAQFP